MDEVDIDNTEDLNELEARLYAQIHHEPTNVKEDGGQAFHVNVNNSESDTPNYQLSSNRNLSKRYWACTENDKSQRRQDQQQCNEQFLIRNPFKKPNQGKRRRFNPQPMGTESTANKASNSLKDKDINFPIQNIKGNTENTSRIDTAPSPPVNNGKKKNKSYFDGKQKHPSEISDLKLNPIADWMKRKKNHINRKSNGKSSSVNIKQGLFSRQQQKLEKVKRIEEKKKRSNEAKKAANVVANKLHPIEVIDLDSDNESDSSDVVVIPTAPPPTFTVDDSADEEETKVNMIIEHEENAVDSTDVQLSSTTASFIKPKEVCTPSLIADSDEKRLESSSRCTSPCSIQSSDDFIRNIDRVRLLSGGRGMADDEDLLELTSDMNILAESSDILKPNGNASVCSKNNKIQLNCNQEELQEETVETSDTLEFATPNTKSQSRDYRVDQSQFKALDVYESESDITDNVYSKGTSKSTVIRQIDSSSDNVEDISQTYSQRTKRLRKRRASSSNKESDPNNENLLSSSEDENTDDDNKLLRTPVPYIAKGPAVERSKPQKRNRSSSSGSSNLQKSKSPKTNAVGDNTSDTEFLTTLNNLAHGQGDEQEIQNLEESEESETEFVPTAREIAEKILSQHGTKSKINESFTDDMALPNDILSDLDQVFETIDQLDKQNSNSLTKFDNAVRVSDSSDSDRENCFSYPSVQNEVAQIIKYSPKNTAAKTHDENGSPIYNMIYIRGLRKPGGIGWSDEMRKFYNDSWNGEYFILNKVLQKMNPEKNIWKICTEDRFNIKTHKRSNLKCTNCCEFGHKRSKCKRPRKPMICYMCGESGHCEPRCPNTVCLRCGNKTLVFTKSCNACSYQNRLTCPICKIRGHSLDYCPDKWRRYHSTTEANVQPNNKVDYNSRKYCCICGARGHFSDSCRSALRFLEYPSTSSSIKSHQKSYSDVVVRAPHNGIALNLMYDPCQEHKLGLAEQTSYNKYYGRFLKAVGMDFLLSRKRNSKTVVSKTLESSAKKTKRLSKKYEANPYLKAASINRNNNESMENIPNQVQEITESGNIDQHNGDNHPKEKQDVVDIEGNSENEIRVTDIDEEEATCDIEKSDGVESKDENFKSPQGVVTITTSEKISASQTQRSLELDSDSNYSFSEHFDGTTATEGQTPLQSQAIEELSSNQEIGEERLVASIVRPNAREMEALPDFIPLVDSTQDQSEQNNEIDSLKAGISRKFVAAESDEEDMEGNSSCLPCEAKIYLTHFHTKYLLSPQGNEFLVKTARKHDLKARLDFTSVGHVLVIFGLISNQDKFQRALLLKYRDLEDEINQRQVQSNINVPKRTFVLIKFLRDNITQLMNNLGNANHLLNRLQYLERQQTKSGFKLAEKVRRSLNMILVGQAGLQDGTMHLDKLLLSLKTLLNDVTANVAPPELRSEITDHWKVIFSAYRHDNYQKLVDTYNKLVSKNRLPQLNIDPLLLGQKLLDTSFSEEQKQKLEQPRMPAPSTIELPKQILNNPLRQKNGYSKQNTETVNLSKTNSTFNANKTKITTLRADNSSPSLNTKKKSTLVSTPTLQNTTKTSVNASTSAKTKVSNATISNPNKAQQPSISNARPSNTTYIEDSKKQPQKQADQPPFSNSEKRSIVSTTIQQVVDNWKSACDTLLTEISSDKSTNQNLSGIVRESKIPSTFWSRESMRYLDNCILLAAARTDVVERLQRVQTKSKNGQLSYNDYLAVIKLHTALNGK